MRWLAAALVIAATSPALAEAPVAGMPPPATSAQLPPLAIAVNPPLRWADAGAVGISGYAKLSEHQVLRLNFATWKTGSTLGDVIAGAAGAESFPAGRVTDIGGGWSYFPRRAFDGFWVEAGLLRRSTDTEQYDSFAGFETTGTTTLAARALVGWSWLGWNRVFLSTGVGLSAGYEWGTETFLEDHPDAMEETTDVSRADVGAEFMLRIGGVLGQ